MRWFTVLPCVCLGLVAAAGTPAAAQEQPPTEPATRESVQGTTSQALTASAREVLERIGSALEANERDTARELLRETVERLVEPQPGEEQELLAFLLELDRLARDLGSLGESKHACELTLAIRQRFLPHDDPSVLAVKQDLAATMKELGDLGAARKLEEEVLEARERLLPLDHPDLLASRMNLAVTIHELGDHNGARDLLEEVLDVYKGLPPSLEHARVEENLAATEFSLRNLARAHEMFERVLEIRTQLLPKDHLDLLKAKQNFALTTKELGDLPGALELEEEVLEARLRLLPKDHPDLLRSKHNLAATRFELGDFTIASELFVEVFEAQERLLPEDHPDLLSAMQNLAVAKREMGDFHGACELEEQVLEARERLLPEGHPDIVMAMGNLAITRRDLGDLTGARELQEDVLRAWMHLLPEDHPEVLAAMQNLAVTRYELGDLAGAHELEEELLEARMRLLPEDHPDLLDAKQNLAGTKYALGDLSGARELFESVLEAHARLLPEDHPDLLTAKQNLAVIRKDLGDLLGARVLEEDVLEARTRLLPEDHPDVLVAMQNLAGTKRDLGDLMGARDLEEHVLEARERLLPKDHPDLLAAKGNLALTTKAQGDLASAREIEEEVLEARTRLSLSMDHPDLLIAKQNLAATRRDLGDLAGARELEEEVLTARMQLLPLDHPDLLTAQQNLAGTRSLLRDASGAQELVADLLYGVRARARGLHMEAARPAREGIQAELKRLSEVLSLGTTADPDHTLEDDFFAAMENLRAASVASSENAHALAAHPELRDREEAVAGLRARLNDLASAVPENENDLDAWRLEVLRLAEERDSAERGLRKELGRVGAFVGEIDADALGARFAPGAAAVSFLEYARHFERDPDTGKAPTSVDSLLAFVVRPGGAVVRVELGPVAEVEGLVGEWRAALGRPLAGRGIGVVDAASGDEPLDALGVRLRRMILDPILTVAGDVQTLHVVLDDVLHLVPLDALPDEQGLVGERLAIRPEVTLARLLRDDDAVPAGGHLILAGGLDYDAELAEGTNVRLEASTPPIGGSLERGGAASFTVLPGTTRELESIAKLYREAFGREATSLTRAAGTKAALFSAAPRARFLHLATHGWFAGESVKSQLDAPGVAAFDARRRAEATVTGFAPETLCGLALAGANRGKDAFGRVPGVLTAEELATFDLQNCELAVLSACETNVGIRRAGQGIQSLQNALHAAGARTAVTSLWKVDDSGTHRLFELFYTKLWKERLGKAEALWQAKMALRAEGYPPRDWAGWVLSGDPE